MHTYSIGSLTRWCVVGGGAPHQRAAAAATAPSARSRQASSWMAFEKGKMDIPIGIYIVVVVAPQTLPAGNPVSQIVFCSLYYYCRAG